MKFICAMATMMSVVSGLMLKTEDPGFHTVYKFHYQNNDGRESWKMNPSLDDNHKKWTPRSHYTWMNENYTEFQSQSCLSDLFLQVAAQLINSWMCRASQRLFNLKEPIDLEAEIKIKNAVHKKPEFTSPCGDGDDNNDKKQNSSTVIPEATTLPDCEEENKNTVTDAPAPSNVLPEATTLPDCEEENENSTTVAPTSSTPKGKSA